MTSLPYIDRHSRPIEASPEDVWAALLGALPGGSVTLPSWLTAAWGLQPSKRRGTWAGTPAEGDTLVGFTACDIERPRLLTLGGRHRFAQYELRFELEEFAPAGTRLSAVSSARFLGLNGWLYRLAVIGTGGHRVAVARMLARVAQRAEAPGHARSDRGQRAQSASRRGG